MSFLNLVKIFFSFRLEWKIPPKKNIMIYDRNLVNYFLKYFKEKDISILETRAENINVPVILITLFKTGFKNISTNYFLNYIYFVKPKIVLTAIDNDLRFYALKEKSKIPIKTIAIQNGLIGSRNYFENFRKIIKINNLKLSCDYILCANEKIKEEYKKIIKSKFISIGSFKNNSVKVNKSKLKNYILFISQYSPPKKNIDETFLVNKNYLISHKSYYQDDIAVLKKLINFCEVKKLKLYIKLRRKNSEKEKKFYKDNVNLSKTRFISSTNLKNNYQIIDKAKIAVFVDSFMGYEAFGRGKKIVAFPIRAKTLKLKNANFADNKLPEAGIFWSNKCKQKILDRMLNNLIVMKNKNWIKLKNKYENSVMLYDENNKIFKKIIKNQLKN
jgi:surface carbohydrate biosynthesis protein